MHGTSTATNAGEEDTEASRKSLPDAGCRYYDHDEQFVPIGVTATKSGQLPTSQHDHAMISGKCGGKKDKRRMPTASAKYFCSSGSTLSSRLFD